VRLLPACVAEENRKYFHKMAIFIKEKGSGWYVVEVGKKQKKKINWRGKENMKKL
jgi:predicted nucleic acid-binding Zn ribbon protein